MFRRTLAPIAVLLLSACDGDEGRRRRTRRDAAAAAAPDQPLEVLVDGKPVAMRSAHAWPAERGLSVVVSSRDRPCPVDDSPQTDDDELVVHVDLQRVLLADGAFRWQVHMFGGFMSREFARNMPVNVEGDGAVVARTRVTVDFGYYDENLMTGARKNVQVRGTIDALGCPPPPSRSPAPPRPPAQDAWLEVAGHRLPIVGAKIDADGEVTLSTGTAPCGNSLDGNAEVIVMVDPESGESNGRPLAGATIMGAWFDTSRSFSTDRETVTATPRGDLGGATVELELRGRAEVMGYALALGGVVTATVCR